MLRGPAFQELMEIRDGGTLPADELTITRGEPLFATPFRMGEVLAEVLGARAIAANDLWQLRGNRRQKIHVHERAASATALAGTGQTRELSDGVFRPIPPTPDLLRMVALTQPWPAAGDDWFLPHTNLRHLEERVLRVLQCEPEPASVAAAVRTWKADDLEDALATVRACGGKVRTPEEWLEHEQGRYLASRPVVEVTRINSGDPSPLPEGDAPLAGVRVLDLTRILAGPTAALSLVEHGADVLNVAAEHLPQVPAFVRDTSHGKRSTFLDIRRSADRLLLATLVRDSDVFIDGYRPGALAERGFGIDDVLHLRPGAIHVSVSAFGSGGPFVTRAGWDQVAQAVTGMCHIQGIAANGARPQLTPEFVCDFLAGYLAAFGTMVALRRRAVEGGSYSVSVSLCQAAMLLMRHGLDTLPVAADNHLTEAEFARWAIVEETTSWGTVQTLGPVVQMSDTPCRWPTPSPVLGGDAPTWNL